MRRVFCRIGVILALVVVLLAPASAFANDPEIQPPFPHAVSPVLHSSFWQIVRIVLFNA